MRRFAGPCQAVMATNANAARLEQAKKLEEDDDFTEFDEHGAL